VLYLLLVLLCSCHLMGCVMHPAYLSFIFLSVPCELLTWKWEGIEKNTIDVNISRAIVTSTCATGFYWTLRNCKKCSYFRLHVCLWLVDQTLGGSGADCKLGLAFVLWPNFLQCLRRLRMPSNWVDGCISSCHLAPSLLDVCYFFLHWLFCSLWLSSIITVC